MAEKLLTDFPPVSTAQWEAAIIGDLKNPDALKKLVWRTAEGMAAKPFYRAEDTAALEWTQAAPGSFPFVRGARENADWRIREWIDAPDPIEANREARAAIAGGAEEIAFRNSTLLNVSDIALLLNDLDSVPVHIASVTSQLADTLVQYLQKANRAATLSSSLDPLLDVDRSARLAHHTPFGMIPFTIEGVALEEAGATAAQETGFTLAAGVEYLAQLEQHGIDPARSASLVQFEFAVGSNFFFEIAKLRAFRMLWARVAESFGIPQEQSRAPIHARSSRWNKTIYDPEVNILRATTEAMAAVIGGANSIALDAFDAVYRKPDQASARLARNTQVILKREAMLARVADPGGGSYALESITNFLGGEAWNLMQQVEERGGFQKASKWIEETLAQSLQARASDVSKCRRVFVGTNRYANVSEKALARTDPERLNDGHRGARAFEELRLRTERHGKDPRVLLVQFGDVVMQAARAQFAAGLFACAGFEVAAMQLTETGEVLRAEADLIMLCSSNAEYLPLATELLRELKNAGRATPVIVAGNPENAAEMKAQGVADFIHSRSNALQVLAHWQQRLGIEA